jgi:hypothetical protein
MKKSFKALTLLLVSQITYSVSDVTLAFKILPGKTLQLIFWSFSDKKVL